MTANCAQVSGCSIWTWPTSGTNLPACPGYPAFWALRAGALEETGASVTGLIEDLQSSRDHGLEHVGELVEEWSERIAVPRETIRFYLTNNIHLHIG